jgi:hypothetical protein
VKYLITVGVDVNQQLRFGSYGSALATAAYWGWEECVEILIKAGAMVHLKLENGPFRNALEASKADILEEDLNRVSWSSKYGKTQRWAKAEIAALLERHGSTT